MFEPPLTKLQLAQGEALRYAHELMMAHNKMTISEAVNKAIQKADCPIPQNIEDAMVRALAKMLFKGFPSDIEA